MLVKFVNLECKRLWINGIGAMVGIDVEKWIKNRNY